MATSKNSFGARAVLTVGERTMSVYRLDNLSGEVGGDVGRLPFSLKILLENLLRHEDGLNVTPSSIAALASWAGTRRPGGTTDRAQIALSPARILMQDFTGVPVVADLAAMRDAMVALGGDPLAVQPQVPAELVIDHSVIADFSGRADAFRRNSELEFERNEERYRFLRWGQQAFSSLKVVPPDTGICHQVNLEHLARVVFAEGGEAYPDTLLGTDSHTTMVNGLGVLGWGVGGIEAEAAMLGEPVTMLIPDVVGFKLTGELPEGSTATDLVLTVTELLRGHGVVGKFVEFYGAGVAKVALYNRATIGNMSPEYGSTCAIFPIDDETLRYLRFTGRSEDHVKLVEAYAKDQGLWHDPLVEPVFSERIELDLSTVEPSLAGPARPQDRVPLRRAKAAFADALAKAAGEGKGRLNARVAVSAPSGASFDVGHGDVVIAAITSCTNTSNPEVMIAAGLVAKRAVERGLSVKPWVKTSLAPGSKVVMDYYERAGLTPYLDKLGFGLVGFGCTTCIGNSGPLLAGVSEAIAEGGLAVASVLSGNRNFEGRINPDVRLNYLASPPLVVAYALAGSMDFDIANEPLGTGTDGEPVYLRDIWPSSGEVAAVVDGALAADMFQKSYAEVFLGDERWSGLEGAPGRALRVGRGLDLRTPASVFRRHARGTAARPRHPGGEGAGPAGQFGHHRPHLTRRQHPQGRAGRGLADRARGGPGRFQQLRISPGQPRGHGAGHVRQCPPAQPAGPGYRGRVHHPFPDRRADHDLRRRHALHRGGHAPGGAGRPGVRFGFFAGLGGQGHRSARRARRAGRELRAHPPVQPHRHGRPASPVPARRVGFLARPYRGGGLRHHRPGRRRRRRAIARPPVRPGRRGALRGGPAYRHPGGGGLLPPRGHPALRPAPAPAASRRYRLAPHPPVAPGA